MSKKQFLSTIILLVFLNLFIKALFIFGIDLQVQRRVGSVDYGLYFTLLNLCYIFQIINDFGLNLLHNTDTAARGFIHRGHLSQILRLKFLLSIAYIGIVILVAAALGYWISWHILIWLIINNVLVSIVLLLRGGISGMARYKTDAIMSVLDKAVMIVICGFIFMQFDDFRIEWFVWAQTASLVFTAAVAWVVTSGFMSKLREAYDKMQMAQLVRQALPFTLASFLMFVYTRSDSILIEQLMPEGAYAAGVYAAGYRLLDAANMIAFLFGPLLIPMFVRMRDNRSETVELVRVASGLMICMTFIISAGGFYWAKEIMALCYKTGDAVWVSTFRLLILIHVPVGLMYVFSSYLTAMRKMKQQITLFAASVAINLGLNFLLIPLLGTEGAASASLVTQIFTSTGLVIMVLVTLKQRISFYLAGRILVFLGIVIGCAHFLSSADFPWWSEIITFFVLACIAAFVLGLLQWQAFVSLLKEKTVILRN